MCRFCKESCPTGAIDVRTDERDPYRCIACPGCISRFPYGVLSENDMSESWEYNLNGEQISVEKMRGKKILISVILN